ncbi:MAG: DISARM system phospholipase D-like protein DrmC [Candidatus Tyrphobacter sp.]
MPWHTLRCDEVSPQLLSALQAAAQDLPDRYAADLLAVLLACRTAADLPAQLSARGTVAPNVSAHADEVRLAWGGESNLDGTALAAAFSAVCQLQAKSNRSQTELVWTGPATRCLSMRRTAAVLFELIGEAESEVVLMSFAAYHSADLLHHLIRAADRGVQLHLLLESATESGGRLKVDGERAFRELQDRATFYYWPREKRGSHGAVMHAKATIVDGRTVFITSANLTENAISENIELGVVLRDTSIGATLRAHFRELTTMGIVVPYPRTHGESPRATS